MRFLCFPLFLLMVCKIAAAVVCLALSLLSWCSLYWCGACWFCVIIVTCWLCFKYRFVGFRFVCHYQLGFRSHVCFALFGSWLFVKCAFVCFCVECVMVLLSVVVCCMFTSACLSICCYVLWFSCCHYQLTRAICCDLDVNLLWYAAIFIGWLKKTLTQI